MNNFQKSGSPGWITAGWIFAFLGGFLGIMIGANYAYSWFGGNNYNEETRSKGRGIFWFGIVMTFFWWFVTAASQ